MMKQTDEIKYRGYSIILYVSDENEYGKLLGEFWTVVAIIKPGQPGHEYEIILGIGKTIFEAKKDAVDRARKFIDAHMPKLD